MFDVASRYQLVEHPQLNPAMDFITKNTVGPFVDTGLMLNKFDTIFAEANGARIYISVETLRELAEGAGLFEPWQAEVDQAHERGYTEGVAAGRTEVEEEHGTARDLVAQLGGLGLLAPPVVEDDDINEGVILTTGVAPEGAVQRRSRTRAAAAGSGDAEGPAAEPATGQGDGTPRHNRSARFPVSTGDGASFRI